MNYELVKKLKDAGFPQDLDVNSCFLAMGKTLGKKGEKWMIWTGIETPIGQKWYKVPTLSELLEACGDVNFTLNATAKHGNDNTWYAGVEDNDYKEIARGNGKFPEEAVANLWLELNKK